MLSLLLDSSSKPTQSGTRVVQRPTNRLVAVTFHSAMSATFSPSNSSGPCHALALFTEPSASFWNSITKGAAVVKKRVSDSGRSSNGSSPKTEYCTYNLPDFSVTLNLNSPLKMYSPVNV